MCWLHGMTKGCIGNSLNKHPSCTMLYTILDGFREEYPKICINQKRMEYFNAEQKYKIKLYQAVTKAKGCKISVMLHSPEGIMVCVHVCTGEWVIILRCGGFDICSLSSFVALLRAERWDIGEI